MVKSFGLPKINLKEFEEEKKRIFEERAKFIKRYKKWVKKHAKKSFKTYFNSLKPVERKVLEELFSQAREAQRYLEGHYY